MEMREDPITGVGEAVDARETRQPSQPAIARDRRPHVDGRIHARVHFIPDADMQNLTSSAKIDAVLGSVEIRCRDVYERHWGTPRLFTVVVDLTRADRALVWEPRPVFAIFKNWRPLAMGQRQAAPGRSAVGIGTVTNIYLHIAVEDKYEFGVGAVEASVGRCRRHSCSQYVRVVLQVRYSDIDVILRRPAAFTPQ